jgi:hypothetical protein
MKKLDVKILVIPHLGIIAFIAKNTDSRISLESCSIVKLLYLHEKQEI